MSNQPKPVAEGFAQDVSRLLRAFAELQTTDFATFVSLWKEHKFSLVFMGRPEDVELTEFTNEIFKVTSQYLLSSTFFFEVGAVYLLYALYRNQISDPPIKIRLELRHNNTVNQLRREATLKLNKTINYIIDFLINNAFVYVNNQVMKGPMIATIKAEPRKSETYTSIRATYKSDIIEYMSNNKLEFLNELRNEYGDVKQMLDEQVKLNKNVQNDVYEQFYKELETFAESGTKIRKRAAERKGEQESIGTRRAKIKAQSFTNKSIDFWGRNVDTSEDEDEPEKENDDDCEPKHYEFKRLHGRRARAHKKEKGERRVGRPRKNPIKQEKPTEIKQEEVWFDISELPDDKEVFCFPPSKEFTETGRRKRASRFHYYKLSPRHEDEEEYEGEEEEINAVTINM